jgi:DNA (cytosine-5)-methyltransferase 1
MGEQVSGKAGANWFDGICSDLESQSYSCEALDIPACAVNSYHQRQRLYWVSSDNLRQRMQRHIKTQSIGQMRQGGASSKVDLRKVFDSPFNRGCGFPQPLIRKMDDGFPSRVGRLRAYGNAIVPPLAAEVIKAFMDTEQ